MTGLLAAAAERLFAQHADAASRRAAFEDSGFARLFSTDADATLVEGLGVVAIAARWAADGPFAETLLADRMLRGVATPAGAITVAVGHDIRLRNGKLDGTALRTPWGRSAAWLLSAHGDETLSLSCLADAQITPGHNMAGEERDTVRLEDVTPVWTGRGESLAAYAALFRAAQMEGAMARALEIAVTHAAVRRQFGKPLAALQAVQQLVAAMIMEVTATRAAVAHAAEESDTFLAGVAKMRAGEAATKVAAAAHQVLGAIGVSEAHELHRVTRRLWAWRDEWGSEHAWSRDFGRRVCADGGAALWPLMADDRCATT